MSGLVGTIPALSSILVLVIFGGRAQGASDLLTLPALAWPAVALLLAVVVPREGPARGAALLHVLAAIAFTIGLVSGFAATGIALPPGSG